jgi:hypothetical protein
VEPSRAKKRDIKVGILEWAGDKGKGRMNIDGIVELETHKMGFSAAALGHVEPSRAK